MVTRTHDQFYIGDFNGDGKADLFVYNDQDGSRHYLGTMIAMCETGKRSNR